MNRPLGLFQTLGLQAREEAQSLLCWWAAHLPDDRQGGFWGEVGADDLPVMDAPKSAILNMRLLWFFSAMASHAGSADALSLAHRAADYIRRYFIDPDHGGVYWLLDHQGQVLDGKKQGYAQAFAVYAFSEYYRATQDTACLDIARRVMGEIETRFWDPVDGGYIEALGAAWDPVGDQRLSDKDADCPKTMNTHLHILEAYTNLHRVAPDAASHAALARALGVFIDRFIDPGTHHLKLFFDMDWTDHTHAVSYGHDIEASWLVWEAAEVLGDHDLTARLRPQMVDIARQLLSEGMTPDGRIAYERQFDGTLDPHGEWWGQAEGLVGFVNAWQISDDPVFMEAAVRLWSSVKRRFGAGAGDEWTWYADDSGHLNAYKAGMWKCPYHNGRAMIELDRRLNRPQE